MRWLFWSAGYLALHCLLYLLLLRNARMFSREKIIFLYHALSALGLGAVAFVALATNAHPDRLAAAVGGLALHGIYSMSFLELWSLAEGGYSLSILMYLEACNTSGEPFDPQALHRIGASKKESRIRSLQGLRLGRQASGRVSLTRLGRSASLVFVLLARAVNLRSVG